MIAKPNSFLSRDKLFSDLALSSKVDSEHSLPLPFFCVMNREDVSEITSSSYGLFPMRRVMLLSLCFLAEVLPSNLLWSGLRLRNLLVGFDYGVLCWEVFGAVMFGLVWADLAPYSI